MCTADGEMRKRKGGVEKTIAPRFTVHRVYILLVYMYVFNVLRGKLLLFRWLLQSLREVYNIYYNLMPPPSTGINAKGICTATGVIFLTPLFPYTVPRAPNQWRMAHL